jgi:hypothetical protein
MALSLQLAGRGLFSLPAGCRIRSADVGRLCGCEGPDEDRGEGRSPLRGERRPDAGDHRDEDGRPDRRSLRGCERVRDRDPPAACGSVAQSWLRLRPGLIPQPGRADGLPRSRGSRGDRNIHFARSWIASRSRRVSYTRDNARGDLPVRKEPVDPDSLRVVGSSIGQISTAAGQQSLRPILVCATGCARRAHPPVRPAEHRRWQGRLEVDRDFIEGSCMSTGRAHTALRRTTSRVGLDDGSVPQLRRDAGRCEARCGRWGGERFALGRTVSRTARTATRGRSSGCFSPRRPMPSCTCSR